jgi:hypothetical protein
MTTSMQRERPAEVLTQGITGGYLMEMEKVAN